jgi:DNA gyrase subunit B
MAERKLTLCNGSSKIRELPSVILGSDGIRGVQQTLFEIITNAIDRYKAGFGDKIIITRHKDDSYTTRFC